MVLPAKTLTIKILKVQRSVHQGTFHKLKDNFFTPAILKARCKTKTLHFLFYLNLFHRH